MTAETIYLDLEDPGAEEKKVQLAKKKVSLWSKYPTTSLIPVIRDFQRGDHSGQHRKRDYRTPTTTE